MRRNPSARISLLISVALLAPLTLAGCGSSSKPATPDTTVMVYFVGSNLTAGAIGNIEEMLQVGSKPNMNVLIQTGGSLQQATEPVGNPDAMQPSGIDWTHVQRFLVNQGSLKRIEDLGAESKDDPQAALNMGDAVTLANFLKWGATSYPATHYILILWDHGGGVNGGFGTDDVTGDRLSVAAIQRTLDKARADQGVKFDVVGYDACLMANAEVAVGLRSAASYMVASQDIVSSLSWSYVPILEYVTSHPGASGLAIGTEIVDSFATKMRENGIEPFTLSVVDLSMAGTLDAATDAFAQALMRYTADSPENLAAWKQIALARSRAIDWDTSAMFRTSLDLVDMRAFVSGVVEGITTTIAPDAALTAAGTGLVAAIDAAVVYEISTGSDLSATGLSIYFPSILSTFPGKDYANKTASGTTQYFAPAYTNGTNGLVQAYYDFFLNNWADLQASVELSPDPASPLDAWIENGFDSALAAHWVASCRLYTKPSAAQAAVTAPCYSSMQAVQSTGSVEDMWVTFDFGNGWPMIGNLPVVLLPDHAASVRLEDNSFLLPAYAYRSATADYVAGYLAVEEDTLVSDVSRRYHATGFQQNALVPGKAAPLVNGQVFALGAYYVDSLGRAAFFRSDQEVTVTSGTLQVTMGTITGGQFAWFVTDLTGEVVESARVPFVPPVD